MAAGHWCYGCRGPPGRGAQPPALTEGFSVRLCDGKPRGILPRVHLKSLGLGKEGGSSDRPGLLGRPLAGGLGVTWDLSAVQGLPTHAHVHAAPLQGSRGDRGGRCRLTTSHAPLQWPRRGWGPG